MSEEQFRARVGRRGFLRGAGVGAAGIAAAAGGRYRVDGPVL